MKTFQEFSISSKAKDWSPEGMYNAGASEKESEMMRFFKWFNSWKGSAQCFNEKICGDYEKSLLYWRQNVDTKKEGE